MPALRGRDRGLRADDRCRRRAAARDLESRGRHDEGADRHLLPPLLLRAGPGPGFVVLVTAAAPSYARHSERMESSHPVPVRAQSGPDRLQNFRDVGGLASALGARIRHGALYRSDAPRAGDAPPTGVAWPPATVIDLRSAAEAEVDHALRSAGSDVHSVPLMAEAGIVRLAEDPVEPDAGVAGLYLRTLASVGPAFATVGVLSPSPRGPPPGTARPARTARGWNSCAPASSSSGEAGDRRVCSSGRGGPKCKAHPGELLRGAPQTPSHLTVLGSSRASYELGGAALLHEPTRTGVAVAGDVRDGSVERRQRAAVLVLGERAVSDDAEQRDHFVATGELEVGRRIAGMGGRGKDV